MHRAEDLIRSLRNRNVTLWAENGQLAFKAPKGALLPEDVALLRELKLEVIRALESDPPAADTLLAPRSATDVVPLTFQQQALWNRYQAKPDERHVLIALPLRWLGPLNTTILQEALCAVCARHEALRTTILSTDAMPRQVIAAPVPFDLDILALHSSHTQDVVEEAGRLARAFLQEPIDLAAGPLFKVRLLQLGPCDHVLVLAMDHMISDALSGSLLIRDLVYSYADLARGVPISLPKVPLQYADYAVWQRRSHAIWKHQHGSYWQRRLKDARRIQLPRGEHIADAAPFSAAELEFLIDEEATTQLRQLAVREKTTAARAMLAVYAILVSVLSSTRDFVLPFTFMGRHLGALDETIGWFAQILYLRIQLAENDTFADVLRQVSTELHNATEHVDFGQMELLMPEFHTGTRFQWNQLTGPQRSEDVRTLKAALSDLRIETFKLPEPVAAGAKGTIDVVCNFFEGPRDIVGRVAYRTDLFTADTMMRFISDLKTLTQIIAQDPQVALPASKLPGGRFLHPAC